MSDDLVVEVSRKLATRTARRGDFGGLEDIAEQAIHEAASKAGVRVDEKEVRAKAREFAVRLIRNSTPVVFPKIEVVTEGQEIGREQKGVSAAEH